MSRRTEAILTALILTAVIAIPTASQNVEYDSRTPSSPVIDSTSNMEVRVAVSPEVPTTARIEKHESLYTVKEKPSMRLETLSTPEAVLKIKTTNDSMIYKLETARGELIRGVKNGRKIRTFEGVNRSEVLQKFRGMKEEAEELRTRVRKEMTPEIELKVTRSKADDQDERVTIENDDSRKVDLKGWTLQNSDGETYTLENLELDKGQRAYLYTAEKSELNVTEKQGSEYIYDTGTDWDTDSETASLYNTDAILIAEDTY